MKEVTMSKCTRLFTRLLAPAMALSVALAGLTPVDDMARGAVERTSAQPMPTCDACDRLARRLTPYLPPVGAAGAVPLTNRNLFKPNSSLTPTLKNPLTPTLRTLPKSPAIP